MNNKLSLPYKVICGIFILFFAVQGGRTWGQSERRVEIVYIEMQTEVYIDKTTSSEEQYIPRAALSSIPEISELLYSSDIEPEPNIPAEFVYIGDFSATAYCPCAQCSDEWGTQTATGATAQQGVTVAVDPSIVPYGTVIYIEGVGIRIAQDCGGAIQGQELDIYYKRHGDALDFGRQALKVWEISYLK